MKPTNEKIILFVLALAQFAHIMDFMIIMPLGKLFMEYFSINAQQFSYIVSVYAFSSFIAGLIGSMFLDRFDRKKALMFLLAGFTIGTFACAFANSYYLFLATRSITGMFGGLIGALALSVIGDVFPVERRSFAMGILMMAFSVSSIAGIPLGNYLADVFGWQMPFYVIGVIATIAFIVVPFGLPSMTSHIHQLTRKKDIIQPIINALSIPRQRAALLFNFILILGHFSIIPFIAPYMQFNLGFEQTDLSYIYAVGGVASFFALPAIGRLSDRFGNKRIFTIFTVFALISIFWITNLGTVGMILAIAATTSLFAVSGGRTVPALTLTTSVVTPEERGAFMSLRSSVNEAALALASLIGGWIIVQNEETKVLSHYEEVGYFAIVLGILAAVLARRLNPLEVNKADLA